MFTVSSNLASFKILVVNLCNAVSGIQHTHFSPMLLDRAYRLELVVPLKIQSLEVGHILSKEEVERLSWSNWRQTAC